MPGPRWICFLAALLLTSLVACGSEPTDEAAQADVMVEDTTTVGAADTGPGVDVEPTADAEPTVDIEPIADAESTVDVSGPSDVGLPEDVPPADAGVSSPDVVEVDVETGPACSTGEDCDTPGAWCEGTTCEDSCVCAPNGKWMCGVSDGGNCGSGAQTCFIAGGCEECTCTDGSWVCEAVKKPKMNVAPEALPPIPSLPLDCSEMAESADPQALQRRWIHDAEARDAVCNDGTPGAYYVRPGSGQNASKWIIHLKAGAACQDYCSCRTRWLDEGAEKMSSSCWEEAYSVNGIFNPDPAVNPDFHDWTVVYIRYCTSDGHIGNNAAEPQWGDIHWRGHQVVVATVEDLEDATLNPDPNLTDATHVLFTGSSAGSQGARHYFDWMTERMGPDVTVRGVLDASMKPSQAYAPIEDGSTAKLIEMKNPWVDASCLAETESMEACLTHTWVVLNHVTTPYFAKMTQRDAIALGSTGTSSDEAYAFAADVRELMDMANGHLPEGTGSYSRDGTSHVDLTQDFFMTLTYQGYSFRDILINWVTNKQPEEDHPHSLVEYP